MSNETINQKVTYLLTSGKGNPVEKTIEFDGGLLQKDLLLQLYYCDMMKIRARTFDVVNYVSNWLYAKCCQNENFETQKWVIVPGYESYQILAQIYAKQLIESVEEKEGNFFMLSQQGKDTCKDYLI